MKRNNYALEGEHEFGRLEHQSSLPEYDYRKELAGLSVPPRAALLDAGCGSAVVTRYLATLHPNATVTGCDVSSQRIEQAGQACRGFTNIALAVADVAALSFEESSFDAVVCRYVLHHLGRGAEGAVRGLVRCLKPGGSLRLIDADGIFVNLAPQPPAVADALARLEAHGPVDFRFGRRIPSLMHQVGLRDVDVRIEAIAFTGAALEREAELMRARLDAAAPLLSKALGGELAARRFAQEYLAALRAPGSCYFHTMFIATGRK